MTAPWDGLPNQRWTAADAIPAMDLHQRKPWDIIAEAGQSDVTASPVDVEFSVAGADLPLGRFSLPDETPVFLPHNYEPNYPYPLLVWLYDDEWTARELLDLTPRISPQNYLGLAVEGLTPTNRFVAGPLKPAVASTPIDTLLETLKDVVIQMRREFHVHSERIYVAGFGDQAATALRLLLQRPDWFSGALAFGCRLQQLDSMIANYDALRGKRVWLSAGIRDSRAPLAGVSSVSRLLHSAGLHIVSRAYDTGEEPSVKQLADINHWLMHGIHESTLV